MFTVATGLLTACGAVEFQGEDLTSENAKGVVVYPYSQSIDIKAESQVDILFVVDNSGSMAEEQVGLSNKINGFMNIVKDLDWQVALTTTDPDVNTRDKNGVSRPWGDGQFRPLDSDTGNRFFMSSKTDSLTTAQSALANAIMVGTSGSGYENSISNTFRALERRSSSSAHAAFFRPSSHLVIINISDEDECGGGPCPTFEKSIPKNLVNFVKAQFSDSKLFSFNTFSRAASDSQCSSAIYTPIYEEMANLTGGVVGSVCSNDYTQGLSRIGSHVIELVRSVQLGCEPTDMDGDGKGDVVTKLANGQISQTSYTVNGTTVTFAQALPEGKHSFSYFCEMP